MGRNATVSIYFDDGSAGITLEMNNNTLSFEKVYSKSGYYNITGNVMNENSTSKVQILPSVIFKLKCSERVQVGEAVNCSIIAVMSYPNVSILVDFDDGEERIMVLEKGDIEMKKIFATEGVYSIKAFSIDKYLNKTAHNATVIVIGGI